MFFTPPGTKGEGAEAFFAVSHVELSSEIDMVILEGLRPPYTIRTRVIGADLFNSTVNDLSVARVVVNFRSPRAINSPSNLHVSDEIDSAARQTGRPGSRSVMDGIDLI